MIELGLQRISRLLAPTSLPWRAIHVAGTNGKGSICAYVSGMLDAYNRSAWRDASGHPVLKHARFTSPHLIDRWDCITLDQQPVAGAVFKKRERAMKYRNRKQGIGASGFEILTATAFELFTEEKVDVAVVEVGMGGRLDATNVIGQVDESKSTWHDDVTSLRYRPPPLVSAISSIGLDHQAFLGNTLEEIAREKAGIIKPRVPVVYAPNPPEVVETVRDVARAQRSPLYAAVDDRTEMTDSQSLSALLDYLDEHRSPSPPLPALTRINARVAFASTWLALQRLNRVPTNTAEVLTPASGQLLPPVIDMFQVPWSTTFPGRLQHIDLSGLIPRGEDDPILLDGAHNAQSAAALAAHIERLGYRSNRFTENTITWVLAASDTKDAREILRPLLRAGDKVFTVQFGPVDGMPWVKARTGEALAAAARDVADALDIQDCGGDVRMALERACERAAGGPMVVAGSLYLVGDVMRLARAAARARGAGWDVMAGEETALE